MRAGTRAPDSAPRGPQTPPRRARPCPGTAPHRKAPRCDRPLVSTTPLPPHKLQGRGARLPAHLVPEHLLPVLRALRMQVVAQLAPVLVEVPHVLPDVLPVLSDVLDVVLDRVLVAGLPVSIKLPAVVAQVAPVLLDILHVLPDVLPVLSDVLDVLLDRVLVAGLPVSIKLPAVLAQVAPVLLDILHVLPDVLPVLSDVLDVLFDVLSPCAAEAQRRQRPAHRDHLESLHRRPLPGRNVCCLVGRTPGCIGSFTAGNV